MQQRRPSPDALLGTSSQNDVAGQGLHFFGVEVPVAIVAVVVRFAMTCPTAEVIDHTMGLQVTLEEELACLDLPQHDESAYWVCGTGRVGS